METFSRPSISYFRSQVFSQEISTQELRQAVREINNPPPQPEDPGRSLNPASQEDPDISVELIDGVFYQSSNDNALVAITADYPRLVPAS